MLQLGQRQQAPASAAPKKQRRSALVAHPLALAIPAGVAVLGLLWARRRRRARLAAAAAAEPLAEAGGAALDLQLPRAPPRAPPLPLLPPKSLKVVMCDVRLPVPLAELWQGVFANPADFLAVFHAKRADFDFVMGPWRQADGSLGTRTLRYVTPLHNPLGPRQACNTEVMEAKQLGAAGFVVQTRCTTEGVPFSSNFANYLLWVGLEDGAGGCRLIVTGECRFHNQVWGPLRGKIESESVKGMQKAYTMFGQLLVEQFGGDGGSPAAFDIAAAAGRGKGDASADAFGASTPRTQLAALVSAAGGGQQGVAAVLLLLLTLLALVYRMSLGDVVVAQAVRRLYSQLSGQLHLAMPAH